MMKRLRLFWELVLTAWRLSAGGFEDTAAVAEPEPAQQDFDFDNDSYLADLNATVLFQLVLSTIAQTERNKLIDYMRDSLRNDRQPEAIRAEAAAQVFDDLPVVIARYASRYGRERARAARN